MKVKFFNQPYVLFYGVDKVKPGYVDRTIGMEVLNHVGYFVIIISKPEVNMYTGVPYES